MSSNTYDYELNMSITCRDLKIFACTPFTMPENFTLDSHDLIMWKDRKQITYWQKRYAKKKHKYNLGIGDSIWW